MAEINIYQNPGQSLANIYKGFARQCNPGFVFPEAQTIEAWDIPLKLHPRRQSHRPARASRPPLRANCAGHRR